MGELRQTASSVVARKRSREPFPSFNFVLLAARLPDGNGFQPAFWFRVADPANPQCSATFPRVARRFKLPSHMRVTILPHPTQPAGPTIRRAGSELISSVKVK